MRAVAGGCETVLRVVLSADLANGLVVTSLHYSAITGERVEVWPLILQIVCQLVETDRDFQAGGGGSRTRPAADR